MTRTGSLSEPNYKVRTLQDVNTRYTHLQELKEFWADGFEVLSNIDPQYVSKAQDIKRDQLRVAIFLITVELERLAGYDTEKFGLKKTIDNIHLIKLHEESNDGKDRLS